MDPHNEVPNTYTAILDGSAVRSEHQLAGSLGECLVAQDRQILVVETLVRRNTLLRFAHHRQHPRLSLFGSVG